VAAPAASALRFLGMRTRGLVLDLVSILNDTSVSAGFLKVRGIVAVVLMAAALWAAPQGLSRFSELIAEAAAAIPPPKWDGEIPPARTGGAIPHSRHRQQPRPITSHEFGGARAVHKAVKLLTGCAVVPRN